MSKTISAVVSYLSCEKQYEYEKNGVEKREQDNQMLKTVLHKAITELFDENLTKEAFIKRVGTDYVTHGVARPVVISVADIYDVLLENKDKIDLTKQILKIEYKTPSTYATSLYYNLHQVIEKQNEELKFCAVILNKKPVVAEYSLPVKTQEETIFLKSLYENVIKRLDTTETYLTKVGPISCVSCAFNYLCKPVGFTKEQGE